LLSDASGIHGHFVIPFAPRKHFLSNLGDGGDYARSRLFVYAENENENL